MRTYTSKGIICLEGPCKFLYAVCYINYYLNSDDSYRYEFIPNYSVIELLDSNYFQGIPGLNLDLKKAKYVRENKTPTFISERVPSEKREDYYKLLETLNMEYMDPIEYLIRINKYYSGDKLIVKPYVEKKTVSFDDYNGSETNNQMIKSILENICFGNDVTLNNQLISDENRKIFHNIFLEIYKRSRNYISDRQKEGIEKAKALGKYKGRKPIAVDELKFREILKRVENGEITPKEGAKILEISIDKYYRFKKKLQK